MCGSLGNAHSGQEAEPQAPLMSPAPADSTGPLGVESLPQTQASKGGRPLWSPWAARLCNPSQPQPPGGSFTPDPTLSLISFLTSLP